ncbi:MAG: RCC1 domain-containing protein [Chthoniobacterales bacterium]
MRFLQRNPVIAATGLFFCLAPVIRAQVNGNATINGSAFGQPLTISTSSQFGGAVSSLKWGNKEFINNWDHGRQLSPNYQFFNRYICYNPYESGSLEDGNQPTTTSKLLSLTANGNHLESTTQMAWYYKNFVPNPSVNDACGDPSQWFPVTPYTTPLSNYQVHKQVTVGSPAPNVIEYLTDVFIPEVVQKGINNPTAVLNYEFSTVGSWDVVSKTYRKLRALAGEDDRIKIASTADGSNALGWYSPELLQPYRNPGSVNWWFVVPPNPAYPDPNNPSQPDPNFASVHIGTIDHYDSFNGPGWYPQQDRVYLVIGNLEQVKTTLGNLHALFPALDPEVYDWRDYRTINGLESALPTEPATRNHWLTQGIRLGLRGSKTFSPSQYLDLNPDVGVGVVGPARLEAAVYHYIGSGRAEGRGTVAKPAAGMQHLVVLVNRSATAAGQNSSAQLGNGDTSPSGPTTVAFDQLAVTEVAASDYSSLGVKSDGTVWAWGSNQYGARGNGGTGGNITSPVMVPVSKAVTPSRLGKHAIAVGTGCYAMIDTEGQVWTWGVNWNGRLGDGTTVDRFVPGRVKRSASENDFLTGIVSIAIGGGTMAAIDADGTVWTWGAGANGNLGNGETVDSAFPVQVVQVGANNASTPLIGISQVACGSSGFCIALARNGQVYGWGSNDFSQLGIAPGGALSVATPFAVGPGGIDLIAAGSAHCIAHSAVDGNVYGWGYNGYGQLGNGSAAVAQYPPAPMGSGPDGMTDIVDLAACGNFSAMVRYTDRAVFVAGDNQSGQLAISGNPQTQYLPVKSLIEP